jgi:nitrogen regulatory protein P-II 1
LISKEENSMKQIKAVIRPEKLQEVMNALERVGYNGIMVTGIEGHGIQKGVTHQWRGEKYRLDMIPKVMLDIVVKDSAVDIIKKTIIDAARVGEVGDGKIFIYNVEEVVRIRTGETNDDAI